MFFIVVCRCGSGFWMSLVLALSISWPWSQVLGLDFFASPWPWPWVSWPWPWTQVLENITGFLQILVWHSPILKLHGNQQEIEVSEGNEKRQGIKIPGIEHVFTLAGQAVIKIPVQQQPLYKLTMTFWLLSNNVELIDTRRQVNTNKITLL